MLTLSWEFTKSSPRELKSHMDKFLLHCTHHIPMFNIFPNIDYYKISQKDQNIGYFVINDSKQLVEFFVENNFQSQTVLILKSILQKHNIEAILYRSDDIILTTYIHEISTNFTPWAICMRRKFMIQNVDIPKSVTVELVNESEFETVFSILQKEHPLNAGALPEHRNGILKRITLKKEEYFTIKLDQKIIGVGYFTQDEDPTSEHNFAPTLINEYSQKMIGIGPVIDPDYRNKGFGTILINELIKVATKRNMEVYFESSYKNYASRKTYEKLGFLPISIGIKATTIS